MWSIWQAGRSAKLWRLDGKHKACNGRCPCRQRGSPLTEPFSIGHMYAACNTPHWQAIRCAAPGSAWQCPACTITQAADDQSQQYLALHARHAARLPRAWQHDAPGRVMTAHKKLSPGACRPSCECPVHNHHCSVDQIRARPSGNMPCPSQFQSFTAVGLLLKQPRTASPRMCHTLGGLSVDPGPTLDNMVAGQSTVAMPQISRPRLSRGAKTTGDA